MSMHISKHDGIIDRPTRESISRRYKVVTRAVNSEFNGSNSDTANSLYVGSYGRGTAINTSDVDIMVILPKSEYERYNTYGDNGQSRLLQSVKRAIQSSYPRSDVSADGQVIKINFSDGMKFEILPAFEENDIWNNRVTYKYPDTNMGGNWRSTNPRAEQEAMRKKNIETNHLLTDTCRHLRYVRDNYFGSYHLSGIVIDSFVYTAMGSWKWVSTSESTSAPGSYESILLDYWEHTLAYYPSPLTAPGSNDQVSTEKSCECLGKVLHRICDN